MASEKRCLDIVIVGAGLVGALAACYLAKRGHRVRLYEYRSDIRVQKSKGASMNLALSARGREALRGVGLEDEIIYEHGVEMKGRMIHMKNGILRESIYDRVKGNCIYSVVRAHLNEILLNAAEKYSTVTPFFNHKLLEADVDKGILKFLEMQTQETVTVSGDLIIGADGAYSFIRRSMAKRPRFDCTQTYMDHGYLDISYPPDKDNQYVFSGEHLHIWPRGDFMLIAVPNPDHTFTGNIFAPFKILESLDTRERLLQFFKDQFPDALQKIDEEKLVAEFFETSPKTLISIKCKPYHVGSKVLILGDAAHAMPPFFGQGVNSGFEDILILNELFETYNEDLEKILPEFSKLRCDDGHAICDLSVYNYIEMRDLVATIPFILREHLDNALYRLLNDTWIPLYHSVTFSRMRFQDCITNRAWQDKLLTGIAVCAGVAIFAAVITLMMTNIY
ncbi:hypothetical protein QAD02_018976 [Eretmocerus hayati]|uniref:Uncharacterized protein n=1 Tax=Eretmocerus hayati TaxID=131215 RepID=A0ACC2PHX3_9HYME|nr:hypothetical protein QAD02_018976 [Eretmocerus hayati]